MSLLSNFGQGLSQGGAGDFGSGLQQGLSMVQNAQQIAAQKREREWQKDMTMVKTYIDYAGTKGVTPETSAESINGANAIIQKWYPNMKLPHLTPETILDYAPVLKTGQGLIGELEKNPDKFEFIIGEWGKANAGWDAENIKRGELTDMQKQARQGVTDTLKAMKSSEKKEGGDGGVSLQRRLDRAMLGLREGLYIDKRTGLKKPISNRAEAIDFLSQPDVALDPEQYPALNKLLEPYKAPEPVAEEPSLWDGVKNAAGNVADKVKGAMGGGAPAAAPAKEPTATGPNGEKVVLRNGKWVPL